MRYGIVRQCYWNGMARNRTRVSRPVPLCFLLSLKIRFELASLQKRIKLVARELTSAIICCWVEAAELARQVPRLKLGRGGSLWVKRVLRWTCYYLKPNHPQTTGRSTLAFVKQRSECTSCIGFTILRVLLISHRQTDKISLLCSHNYLMPDCDLMQPSH